MNHDIQFIFTDFAAFNLEPSTRWVQIQVGNSDLLRWNFDAYCKEQGGVENVPGGPQLLQLIEELLNPTIDYDDYYGRRGN